MSVLSALKSLPVARNICREDEVPEHAKDYRRDRITLGWEDRLRARGRRTSDRGFQFGTALPRGTLLRAGDCFVFDDPGAVVVVVEREEPVFVITPRSPAEWGLFAYHIGNNHQPMMLVDESIVCPEVPGIEELLTLHGIAFTRSMRAFTPLTQAMDHGHLQ